jgi:hypothetical protein
MKAQATSGSQPGLLRPTDHVCQPSQKAIIQGIAPGKVNSETATAAVMPAARPIRRRLLGRVREGEHRGMIVLSDSAGIGTEETCEDGAMRGQGLASKVE